MPIEAPHRAERQRAHRRHELAGRVRERGLERCIEGHPVIEDPRDHLGGERAGAGGCADHAKIAPSRRWARLNSAAVTGLRPASQAPDAIAMASPSLLAAR